MRRTTSISLSLAFASLFGCAPNVGTVDRTQPNAIDKSMFEGIWYHRAMVTEADPEAGHFEGITSGMEKIRWDVTQGLLIAYRSYEFVPYAEGLTDEGRDFFGAPVAAFRILSHFDIQREYNAATGIENNVLVENTTDRPWFERRYIRVDWSSNMVGGLTPFWTGWVNYPDAYFSGTAITRYYEQGHVETDVNRPVFTKDYFDVTNNYSLAPTPYYCWMMLLYNSVPRCGAGNAKVRLSFKKIEAESDYEPLYYPDVVELKDNEGNVLVMNGDGRTCDDNRIPSECDVKTYPYDAQFGNFRILRVAFDKERYLTRTGRIYMAGRFNLWEDSFDAAGSAIPYSQRKAKPIVYYSNVHFPREIMDAATRMSASWNVPFSETVAYLKGYFNAEGKPDVARLRGEMGEDMYQFRVNDCNRDNIVAYAKANGLMDVVNRIAGNEERVALGNIEQVCAAVQYAELQQGKTLDVREAREKGIPLAFSWQRKGDLRYNFNNYIQQYAAGPWGVAQFGQDPETGEFIGANIANYFGNAGDIISQRQVDIIQWLNGDLNEEELLRGDFTRNTVASRRSVRNNGIRQQVQDMLMAHERGIIDAAGDKLLAEGRVGQEEERFARMFKGTDIEKEILVTDDILRGFAGPTLYQPFGAPAPSFAQGAGPDLLPGQVTASALEEASPVSWGITPQTNEFMQVAYELGRRAVELASFFDPNTAGMAEFFRGKDRDYIYQWMRSELYYAVQGHEVGHTLGLRHNFRASMDPVNYHPDFWYGVDGEGTVKQYWNNPPTPDNVHRGNEYKYASIMDYAFDIAIEGFYGIGPYDAAAIRFMYGQLVEVWDPEKISIPDPRKYGSWARRCGHDSPGIGLNTLLWWMHPSTIPALLSTPAKDQSACANNYDSEFSCDSAMDDVFRELVNRMESTAQARNMPSQCAIWWSVSDLNWLVNEVKRFEPSAENVFGARKLVTVAQIIQQEISSLTNPPEYDDPSTVEDESNNGEDTDGDGVPDDKGYDWSQYLHQVPYGYCSDMYANFSNPFCQRWDAGWDFSESTQNHIDKFDRDYIFDHFRRDALYPWGNPRAYVARLQARRLFHMTNVYRYYLYTRRSAFEVPLYRDWAQAAYKGINFLERVLQDPEPGSYCLNTEANRYERYSGQGPCAERLDLGLGYGQGKYLNTSWTNEYFYKANRIGSFYDKLAAIQQMTTSSGFFARDLSDLFDRRAFSLGYLRVYLDPLLQRFAALIDGNHEGYRPRVVLDEATGERYVRYMPLFDEELADGSSVREWLRDEPEIEPAWSWSLQFYALAYALANWSSVNDYAPEMYRFTKIAIAGTPEDVAYPDTMDVVEFTDPETLITYRAPVINPYSPSSLSQEFPAYYGDRWHRARGMFRRWGVGANLLEAANLHLTNEWLPSQDGCTNGTNVGTGLRWRTQAEACEAHQLARNELNQQVGFIDRVRKFNRRAEMSFY